MADKTQDIILVVSPERSSFHWYRSRYSDHVESMWYCGTCPPTRIIYQQTMHALHHTPYVIPASAILFPAKGPVLWLLGVLRIIALLSTKHYVAERKQTQIKQIIFSNFMYGRRVFVHVRFSQTQRRSFLSPLGIVGVWEINRGYSKLRMELFLRMNNTWNCSREVPKYFASEIFWSCWGWPLRFSERGRMHVLYVYEYFAVKKLCPLAPSFFLSHTYCSRLLE